MTNPNKISKGSFHTRLTVVNLLLPKRAPWVHLILSSTSAFHDTNNKYFLLFFSRHRHSMHRPLPASLFTSSTRKLSKNARDGAHGPRKRHRKLGMHRRHCRKSGLPESFCTYMAYQGSYLFTNCLAYSTLIVQSGFREKAVALLLTSHCASKNVKKS